MQASDGPGRFAGCAHSSLDKRGDAVVNGKTAAMAFSTMQPGQEDVVIDIVQEAFDEKVAPDYTKEGIETFYKFANKTDLAERSKTNSFTLIAYEEQKAIGIIEIKEYCHVSMFFIKPDYQRQGFGKALFNEALSIISAKKNGTGTLTVNSSLYAVGFYERLGFEIKAEDQCINGIRFVPMELTL